MRRRLALAILAITWGMLLLGGIAVYVVARQTLLAELDRRLFESATTLAALSAGEVTPQVALPEGDRFLLKNAHRQTEERSFPGIKEKVVRDPKITHRGMASSEGTRYRTLTITALLAERDGTAVPVTIVYSRSAEYLLQLLTRLALVLCGVGVAIAVATAVAARIISRAALAPLDTTADAIGQIDERHLDRRIGVDDLPEELRPMAERLNEMLERLQKGFDQRRQFLANAAHELRTPVAAVLTTLEVTLRRPRDAAALTNTLKNCLTDVRLLRSLIDTLMEHARGERAARDEERQRIDAAALLKHCAQLGAALGVERDITIADDIAGTLEVVTHPERLRSVAMNLISNAVAYSRPGGRVVVSAACRDKGLEFRVADSGQGIAAEDLPHIFEPFFRADKAHMNQTGHLGLGLFLVRTHLDALGGRCTVQSTPGVGSTFEVRIDGCCEPKAGMSAAGLESNCHADGKMTI